MIEDAEAVAIEPSGRRKRRLDLGHRHRKLQRMNSQFGLDLETL
jgi:hypothetical protein